jgi:hypothetical protein
MKKKCQNNLTKKKIKQKLIPNFIIPHVQVKKIYPIIKRNKKNSKLKYKNDTVTYGQKLNIIEYKNRKNKNENKNESNEKKPQILNILWSRGIDYQNLRSQTEENEDEFSNFLNYNLGEYDEEEMNLLNLNNFTTNENYKNYEEFEIEFDKQKSVNSIQTDKEMNDTTDISINLNLQKFMKLKTKSNKYIEVKNSSNYGNIDEYSFDERLNYVYNFTTFSKKFENQ